jgi:hypothetical protein
MPSLLRAARRVTYGGLREDLSVDPRKRRNNGLGLSALAILGQHLSTRLSDPRDRATSRARCVGPYSGLTKQKLIGRGVGVRTSKRLRLGAIGKPCGCIARRCRSGSRCTRRSRLRERDWPSDPRRNRDGDRKGKGTRLRCRGTTVRRGRCSATGVWPNLTA